MKKSLLIVFCLIMFLIGWSASGIFQAEKATAAKTLQYKTVDISGMPEKIEKTLNTYAKQGWRFHSALGRILIFEQ